MAEAERRPGRLAVTVGMMVHNEERFVEHSLRSLLRQDESDFELLVLDNASTDGTPSICRDIAAADARVRYWREPRNRGAIHSFARLIQAARGDYFVLAAGHDLWSSNYLSALKQRLDQDSQAVLAFGRTEWIDEQAQPMPWRSGLLDTTGLAEINRFLLVLWNNRNCLYGMHRLHALRKTSYAAQSIAMESVIMQQLAIQGSFTLAPDAAWRRRVVRQAETAEQRLERYFSAGFLFEREKRPLLPFWRIPGSLVWTAWRAPFPWGTRLAMAVCALSSIIFLRDELGSDLRHFPRRLLRYMNSGIFSRKRETRLDPQNNASPAVRQKSSQLSA